MINPIKDASESLLNTYSFPINIFMYYLYYLIVIKSFKKVWQLIVVLNKLMQYTLKYIQ